MIDFGSDVPVNRQLADLLRERIARGEWAPGAYLPSETDLAHEYEVGRDTVREVLARLRSEGLILRGAPGVRSRVMPQIEREQVWPRRGSRVITRMPTPVERRELEIPEGVPVLEVRYRMEEPRLYRGDRYELMFE